MDADRLLRLRLEMEFGVEPDGDILPPATLNRDGQPRIILSRHRDGTAMFFRYDVGHHLRSRLRSLGIEHLLEDEDRVRSLLCEEAPVENLWRVRWYTVDTIPPEDGFPDVVIRDGRHVVLVDGEVAAQAWTTAESARAVEVEVETDPRFRRRGFATQVVGSWAASLLAQGRVAFYSHAAENAASKGVARRLGLTWLSDEVEYQ